VGVSSHDPELVPFNILYRSLKTKKNGRGEKGRTFEANEVISELPIFSVGDFLNVRRNMLPWRCELKSN
jgi:hypothetical protein